jgi:hypothetical protein
MPVALGTLTTAQKISTKATAGALTGSIWTRNYVGMTGSESCTIIKISSFILADKVRESLLQGTVS